MLGSPDREPLRFPGPLGCYQAAVNAAAATMVAIFARQREGLGQQVDISEAQMMATLQRGYVVTHFVYQGLKSQRLGHRGSGRQWPYGLFPCQDGYVTIMTLEDYHWRWFVEVMGSPEWATDPRWGDSFERIKHADELEAHLIGWLMDHTKDEIMELAQARRIPFVKVHNARDLLHGSHLKARDYFRRCSP